MRTIDAIIVHCTATKEGRDVTVDEIRQWHTTPIAEGGRGWRDIGYHYVVGLDGEVCEGRPVEMVGAHCTGHNKTSIGVCYVGGLGADGKPKDTRTLAQKDALVDFMVVLLQRYGLTADAIHGHGEYSVKACPCFDVGELREEVNKIMAEGAK